MGGWMGSGSNGAGGARTRSPADEEEEEHEEEMEALQPEAEGDSRWEMYDEAESALHQPPAAEDDFATELHNAYNGFSSSQHTPHQNYAPVSYTHLTLPTKA